MFTSWTFIGEGAFLCTTDASGKDGVGGYVFVGGREGEVWTVSEPWPGDLQAARARDAAQKGAAGRKRRRSEHGGPALSIPAAELFTAWAVADAVAEAVGEQPHGVAAIVDSESAALALAKASSGEPAMHHILVQARRASTVWLGVAVPREANVDADRLSHPALRHLVEREASEARLRVHSVRLGDRHWDALREALARRERRISWS